VVIQPLRTMYHVGYARIQERGERLVHPWPSRLFKDKQNNPVKVLVQATWIIILPPISEPTAISAL